jgi:hypothetical protein
VADDRLLSLIDQLGKVRAEQGDSPLEDRRQALQHVLESSLDGLAAPDAQALARHLRDHLIQEARRREERLTELTAEVSRLKAELAAGQSLSGSKARSAGQPPTTGGDGNTQVIRELLIKTIRQEQADPASLGLGADETRLVRLIQEVFRFALNYEMALTTILLPALKVGEGHDTVQLKSLGREIGDRFLACLKNEEGSILAVTEMLNQKARFLYDLNKAYGSAITAGGRNLLAGLNPDPILEKNKRFGGYNFQEAWKSLSRDYQDLAGLSAEELAERFFMESLRQNLSQKMDLPK